MSRLSKLRGKRRRGLGIGLVALLAAPPCALAQALPPDFQTPALETYGPSMRYDGPPAPAFHSPLARAAQKWRLCAVLPHVKDPYWLDVVHGMSDEARRLGVALRIVETGGYYGKTQQIAALAGCAEGRADAIILGSVAYRDPDIVAAVAEAARTAPVVAAVNDVDAPALAAKVGVSWRRMGEEVGRWFSARHPRGSAPVKAALASGPREAGWTGILADGLAAGLSASSAQMVESEGADSDTFEQYRLVERLLERRPDADYLIGAAPAAESARAILAQRPDLARIGVVATYFTSTLRRALAQGRLLAAPFDWPRTQGALAVEFAVRAKEGALDHRQIGPRVTMLRAGMKLDPRHFAPPDFEPSFDID
jgi:protein TorT